MSPQFKQPLFVSAIVIAVTSFAAAMYLLLRIHESEKLQDGFIEYSLESRGLKTCDDTVLALARNIYHFTNDKFGIDAERMDAFERLETKLFNPSGTVALKYGGYGVRGQSVFGPCGTMSRLLLNCLWSLQIPARKLQLLENTRGAGGGHTLVEYFDGQKWKVIAPSDASFVWRNTSGEIASVSEIQSDDIIYKQVLAAHPVYPYLFDNPNHFNWSRVPVWFHSFLIKMLGAEYVREIETPGLYENPRSLMFCVCLVLFSLSLGVVVSSLERYPKRSLNRRVKRTKYLQHVRASSLTKTSKAELIRSGRGSLHTS